MMLGRSHTPPDCNLGPERANSTKSTSKMFPSLDPKSLSPALPGLVDVPVRGDLRAALPNVQRELCLDAKALEQIAGLDPPWRAEPLSLLYDAFRMLIAGVSASLFAIFIVASPPRRDRARDYLRPPSRDRSPTAPREGLLKNSLTVQAVVPIFPLLRSHLGFTTRHSATQKD